MEFHKLEIEHKLALRSEGATLHKHKSTLTYISTEGGAFINLTEAHVSRILAICEEAMIEAAGDMHRRLLSANSDPDAKGEHA